MIKRSDWLAITKDRLALSLLGVMVIFVVAIIITTALRIHPSDVQVPVRFTGYGQSNIDRDQWYTQISFAIFAILALGVNGFLAIKLYMVRRALSLGIIAMTIFLLAMTIIVTNAIFNLAPTV